MNPKDMLFYGTKSKAAMERIDAMERDLREHMILQEQIEAREQHIKEHYAAKKAYEEANKNMAAMLDNQEKEKDNSIHTHEEAEALSETAILLDADGWVFQRRNGQWFMAGAQFGSEEFSGAFPAKELIVK